MDNQNLSSNLVRQAIEAALNLNWEDALKINKRILKQEPQNIDTLGRLAKTYLELGRYNLAKKYYLQVLKFDPYNPIALKNIKIIKASKSKGLPHQTNGQDRLSPALFLQEPGKTKIVTLLNVCEPQKLSQTYCGMRVSLIVRNRKLIVVSDNDSYLGVLPDDICHSLLRLIKGGNKFSLFIQSIRVNGLSVLIRETFRSKRFKGQPSFLESSRRGYSEEMLSSLEEKSPEEEGEEEGAAE